MRHGAGRGDLTAGRVPNAPDAIRAAGDELSSVRTAGDAWLPARNRIERGNDYQGVRRQPPGGVIVGAREQGLALAPELSSPPLGWALRAGGSARDKVFGATPRTTRRRRMLPAPRGGPRFRLRRSGLSSQGRGNQCGQPRCEPTVRGRESPGFQRSKGGRSTRIGVAFRGVKSAYVTQQKPLSRNYSIAAMADARATAWDGRRACLQRHSLASPKGDRTPSSATRRWNRFRQCQRQARRLAHARGQSSGKHCD